MPALRSFSRVEVHTHSFQDDGSIPNHPTWPLLVYERALPDASADTWETLFDSNGWGGMWRGGIFSYHHYHSASCEVLGVARGAARVRFGGKEGSALELEAGDAVVLPPGTGHRLLEGRNGFQVVGAYPPGQEDYDLCTGKPGEHAGAVEHIRQTPRPATDPLYGSTGPLLTHWRR